MWGRRRRTGNGTFRCAITELGLMKSILREFLLFFKDCTRVMSILELEWVWRFARESLSGTGGEFRWNRRPAKAQLSISRYQFWSKSEAGDVPVFHPISFFLSLTLGSSEWIQKELF